MGKSIPWIVFKDTLPQVAFEPQIHLGVSLAIIFFTFCLPLLHLKLPLLPPLFERLKFQIRSKFWCGMFYMGESILWIMFKDTLPYVVFAMVLYRWQKDLDHMLWGCQFAQSLWSPWMNLFGLCLTQSRDRYSMVQVLLSSPFQKKYKVLSNASLSVVLWGV